MYNVNANYTLGMGGYPGAAGAGIGAGYMNPAMMGMYAMGPMANVGIGQFRADYLLKGEDQLNNYYARPIAVHKKKDELPTMLGILGTALGTAALLVALAKGKFKRIPRPNPTPGPRPNPGPNPTPGPRPNPGPNPTPGPRPNPGPNPNPGPRPNPGPNPNPGPQVAGLLPHKPINPNSLPAPVYNNPTIMGSGVQTGSVTPATTTPTTGSTGTIALPGGNSQSQVAGLLPHKPINPNSLPAPIYNNPTAVASAANAGAQTSINPAGVPSVVGNGVTIPSPVAHNASGVTILNPGHRTSMPVASWKFGAEDVPFEEVKVATKALSGSQIKGALPAPTTSRATLPATQTVNQSGLVSQRQTPAMIANNNLNAVRPDLASNGSVVYTTHTPETLANGYSIGQNAKGADKLAELLAQMQA